MRKPLEQFANAMETKLQQNDDDKGESGWLYGDCRVRYLLDRLKEETKEAENAFDDVDPLQLQEEVIDIANFAMMIYDRLMVQVTESVKPPTIVARTPPVNIHHDKGLPT